MPNKETIGFIGGKFLPLHQGHVHAITEASTYVDILYVILSSSEKRDRALCERDGIQYITAHQRLSWLGATFKEIKNIVIAHVEDTQGIEDYDWDEGAAMIREAIGKPIDYVFSSEHTYEEHFKKNYPEAHHIVLDSDRKRIPISATAIRKDPYKHWAFLPLEVRKHFVKRVAIVGTESCGKTTLAQKLAAHYNTQYVPETGRIYCEEYSNNITPEMFDLIAMEHYLVQEKAVQLSNKVLFVDSEAVITQYYLNMYFEGMQSPLVEQIINLEEYDALLYLEPDVAWVDDGLRFAGEEETRKKNNALLKKMFKKRNMPLIPVKGNYTERFNKAREVIDSLFKEPHNV